MHTPPAKPEPPEDDEGPSPRDLLALRHDHRTFLRVLILDRWFRIALVAAVLAFLTPVLVLPKFWRATPPGFSPQVRVSLFNLGQAWQLRRSARALEAEGRIEEAAAAWHSAFTKNAGDLETARHGLRVVVESDRPSRRAIERAAALPAWVLALSATNHADVLLVARYLDRAGLAEQVHGLLEPLKDDLSEAEEIVFLKTLVERGDLQQYAARWKRVEHHLANDPEFALYHQAYLAAWGDPDEREPAQQQLAKAAADPVREVVACRLQLVHFSEGRDAEGYANALRQLVERRADRPADHIGYWGLLLSLGRNDEARAQAQHYVTVPPRPQEVVALAEAFFALEMKEQAERLLARVSATYGAGAPLWGQMIWVARANLLIKDGNWQGLLDLADQLRG